jgi:hypothetical protein
MKPNSGNQPDNGIIETVAFLLAGDLAHGHVLADGRRVIDATDLMDFIIWTVEDPTKEEGDEEFASFGDWAYGRISTAAFRAACGVSDADEADRTKHATTQRHTR